MSNVAVPDIQTLNFASLYVGDLKPEVTEQTLWNAFSPYGQVLSVRICRNSQNQASLGYGYVNFRTQNEAEKAMKAVNFTHIEGRTCRIMWSMRDASRRKCGVGNLFIKNIDPVLDTRSLYEAFSAFGPVMSCKIAIDEYGISKGYGFIQFYNERDAEEARKRSDGVPFMKKKIVVTKFIPKAARVDAKPVNPYEYTNIFVKNFGLNFTVEQFKDMFSKFGEITSCVIQQDEKTKSQLGYGFINFSKPESAAAAVAEMDGHELPSKEKLHVCRAMKKLERVAFLRRQFEDRKKEYLKQFENLNLYVKNFDENWDDVKLKEVFGAYGPIQSSHIMTDDSGRSRCFGFVCFASPQDAKKAIEEMNGTIMSEKPLYVAYAQNKDDRRRMIEQRTYDHSFRPPLFGPATVPIVYQTPGPLPFPPTQYARYPAGQRPPHRGMQPGNQAMGPQQFSQPPRHSYGYHNNQNQPQFRQRQGSMAYHQGGGMRANQNYVPRSHPTTVNSMNAVTAEVQKENKKDVEKDLEKIKEKKEVPKKAPIPDSRTQAKDRMYQVCQRIFEKEGYDANLLPRIAGAVIDHFTDSQEPPEENEVSDAVIHAYEVYSNPEKNKKL